MARFFGQQARPRPGLANGLRRVPGSRRYSAMKSAISAFMALVALSAFGQSGPTMRTSSDVQENVRGSIIGTVTSVMETRNQFVIAPDGDRYGTVTVQGAALSTTFRGFGGTINGSPEVFQGSTGMANLREGDRVEVRGLGAANTQLNAEQVR